MGQIYTLFIIDTHHPAYGLKDCSAILKIPVPQSKVTAMHRGTLDEAIITGHANGQITCLDIRADKEINSVNDHTECQRMEQCSSLLLKIHGQTFRLRFTDVLEDPQDRTSS